MTMLPAHTPLSQLHPSRGCGAAHLMNAAPPLVSENYYYYYSHPYLIALHPPMADDDDSTTNTFNQQPSSNTDDGWLQLSIGRRRPPTTSNLVELDLLPGGGGDNPATASRDFLTPEAATTARSETGMQLFFGTPTSSNFVQQEINWAFRPMLAASSSSSFLPVGGRSPFIQFQSSGVQAGDAGPSSDVRIINPPRRPHSGIWFTLKALENQ